MATSEDALDEVPICQEENSLLKDSKNGLWKMVSYLTCRFG